MKNEIEMFKKYFEYNEGYLYWRNRSGTRGRVGTVAGKLRKDGYFDVGLKGKYYLIHRIVLPYILDSFQK